MIYRDRTVEVPVKVTEPIKADLLLDCVPDPPVGTKIGAALDRLAAVEDCLHFTRDELARLRALQPVH